MARTLSILAMATTMIATSYAGQVPIGTGLGGVNGLTSTTVSATTTATQASGGKFGEQTYANGGVTQGATVTTAPPTSGTLTAGGLTYYMVSDSGAFASDNMWAGTNDVPGLNGNPATVSTTFTIPIGIFGVTNVGTILNDEYGVTNVNVGNGTGVTTTVTFNFGSALVGPGFLGSETFDLVNGTVIRDSFLCQGGTGLATCQGDHLGMTFDSSNAYGLNGSIVSPSAAIASVTAANAFSGAYSANTSGPYANTNGAILLDAQNFYLGSFAGDELFNMVITGTANAQFQSRDELEAVTVLTNGSGPSAPEPSTTVLFAAGILVLGLIHLRKRAVRVQ